MFTIAAWLSPNSSGVGTHQQLGLPPCSFRLIYGVRCPACGMTTAWSHFVRGDWLAALSINIAGFLLAAGSAVVVVGCFYVVASGRPMPRQSMWWITLSLLGVWCVAVAEWLVRMIG